MNTVSSLEKKRQKQNQTGKLCECRETMAAFPLQELMYAVNGLFLSPAFLFLGVILVPEEFVSSGIYSICNLQLFSEEPADPEDIIESAGTCSFVSPISHRICKLSNNTDNGPNMAGAKYGTHTVSPRTTTEINAFRGTQNP